MLNIPYSTIGGLGLLFNVTSCDQWYMYEFKNSGSREFWGKNTGSPIYHPKSSGLLDGDTGIMQTACPHVDRASPYFKINVR